MSTSPFAACSQAAASTYDNTTPRPPESTRATGRAAPSTESSTAQLYTGLREIHELPGGSDQTQPFHDATIQIDEFFLREPREINHHRRHSGGPTCPDR
jgi:hypothetical protein